MKTLGEIIRQKREEKKLLLRELSAMLEIDPAILSKIERGERNAKKKHIKKISEILGIDEQGLLIQFLSEKILYDIEGEEFGLEALKVAEERMKYNSKNEI
ncbi:MAG: helix-turn-helix domain-containing protein [Ignavibacteria bacterium]|nr:helix-turn-helix domain-containing protein [Ignavibacteria bacterium]